MAGWRYGFVGIKNDLTPVYSEMQNNDVGTANFIIDADFIELWLVVSGSPTEYRVHLWDDNNANDVSFPYEVKFINTNPL